jgi:hypothetical protein
MWGAGVAWRGAARRGTAGCLRGPQRRPCPSRQGPAEFSRRPLLAACWPALTRFHRAKAGRRIEQLA